MNTTQTTTQLAYCKEFETTLNEIGKYVGDVPMQMMETVMKAGGIMAGPQVWQYEGADGNMDTKFQLTIAVPLTEQVEALKGSTKELEPIECCTIIHNGAWSELKGSYQKVIEEIMTAGKQPGSICREVYHQVDFEEPANNVTEIQMSIQ